LLDLTNVTGNLGIGVIGRSERVAPLRFAQSRKTLTGPAHIVSRNSLNERLVETSIRKLDALALDAFNEALLLKAVQIVLGSHMTPISPIAGSIAFYRLARRGRQRRCVHNDQLMMQSMNLRTGNRIAAPMALLCVLFTPGTSIATGPCVPKPISQSPIVGSEHEPTQVRSQHTVTIASVNIAGQGQTADILASWTQQRSLDVLLLQEVGHTSMDGRAFITQLSERMGVHYAYAPADQFENGYTHGLAILSRFPLADVQAQPLEYHRLRFRSRCRVALAATVKTPWSPIRLVNVHLDTRINTKDRVQQLTPVLIALHGFPGPSLVGGDFNTMNIGWFRTMWPFPYLQRQSAAVRAMLATAGFETPLRRGPATFRFLGLPLRLDWIFVKDLTPREWGVDAVRFTDHRGVWASVTP
jgi:endonuclease/exonuclease/phosphatase (EEP) superfamily protein YafD